MLLKPKLNIICFKDTNNSSIIIKMENRSIEFIFSEDKSLLFDQNINELFDNELPLDGEDIKIYLNGDKEKVINLDELFHLRVNVKLIGRFDFFFEQESFDKWAIVKQVTPLKEMEVNDIESAKAKVNELVKIFAEVLPIFVTYSPKGEYSVTANDIAINATLFYLKPVEKPKPVKVEKPVKKEKSAPVGLWNKIIDFLYPLKENSIHYIFILISCFLIGFSSSIGVYYCYVGNNVFYFLFVCSLVGAILNFFVHFDYFEKHKLMSKDTILTIIDMLIGIGVSIGSFFIFYALQKEKPTSLSGPLVILLIMNAVIILANVIASSLAFLLKRGKKKKEAKE